MKDETGEIFTLDDVAAYLKVGKRTVYRLAAAKKIPAFKVGGHLAVLTGGHRRMDQAAVDGRPRHRT